MLLVFAFVKSSDFFGFVRKRESDGCRAGGLGRPKLNTLAGNICGSIVVNQCTVQ